MDASNTKAAKLALAPGPRSTLNEACFNTCFDSAATVDNNASGMEAMPTDAGTYADTDESSSPSCLNVVELVVNLH